MECSGDIEPRARFMKSFLDCFVPAVDILNCTSDIDTMLERQHAIKLASDTSLAVAAAGSYWSYALSKELVQVTDEECCQHLSSSGECKGLGSKRSDAPRWLSLEPFCRATGSESDEHSAMSQEQASSPLSRQHSSSWCRDSCSVPLELNCSKSGLNTLLQQDVRPRQRDSKYGTLSSRTSSAKSPSEGMTSDNKCRHFVKRKSKLTRFGSRNLKMSPATCKRRSIGMRVPREGGSDCGDSLGPFGARIKELQNLVPGGLQMDSTILLDEAADYLMSLKLQVEAMQLIVNSADLQMGFAR